MSHLTGCLSHMSHTRMNPTNGSMPWTARLMPELTGAVLLHVEPDRRVRERADPAPAAVRDAEVQLRRGGEPGLSLRLPGKRAVRQLRRGQGRGPAQQPVRGLRPLGQRRGIDRHIRHASSGVTAVRTACTIQREAWPWPVQVTRVRM